MFSLPKDSTAVAAALRSWRGAMSTLAANEHPLDAVAARIAVPTERSLEAYLRERSAELKRWQRRRS